MLYRVLGKTGLNVSAFGLGVMRMPVTDPDDSKTLDFERGVEMIRYAIDHGVNYFDSAYVYHGGRSEELLGAALRDGYREKAIIATKLPLSDVKSPQDMDDMLNTSLRRLGVDQIDIYLMHGVKVDKWPNMLSMGVQAFLDRAKADGRIRFAGFSYHDSFDFFKKVLSDYDWDMTMIQLNYIDEHFQAGVEGMRHAAGKGVGVAVMEPLKGGSIVKSTPEVVRSIFDGAPVRRSLAEWAFRWVADHPEVAVVLSGSNDLPMLKDSIRILSESPPGCMSDSDREVIKRVQTHYRDGIKVPCTGCEYCIPCPKGIPINMVFQYYNEACAMDTFERQKQRYHKHFTSRNRDVSACIECGECEAKCPQKIEIRKQLKETHKMLAKA